MTDLMATPRDLLPPEWEDQLQAHLIGTEQVLWWGQPIPDKTGRRFSLLSVIGLFVVAWSVYWSHASLQIALDQSEPNWNLTLLGAAVFLIGIGLLFVPVWAASLEQKTCYVLTSGRAIVFHPLPLGLSKIEEYFPHQLLEMTCVEDESGAGDLVFEQVESVDQDGLLTVREYGFMGIENVRETEALIRRTFAQPAAPAPTVTHEPDACSQQVQGDEPQPADSNEQEPSPWADQQPIDGDALGEVETNDPDNSAPAGQNEDLCTTTLGQ